MTHISKIDNATDDGASELETLRKLLATQTAPSPEAVAKQADLDRRVRATRHNAWVPPLDSKEPHWVIVIKPNDRHLFLSGVDLQAFENDSFPEDGEPYRSWRSYNLKVGINWLPASHFAGEFTRRDFAANALLETGDMVLVPPGSSIPSSALTPAQLRDVAQHALLSDKDSGSLTFFASLMPPGDLRNQLEAKAKAVVDNRTVLTV